MSATSVCAPFCVNWLSMLASAVDRFCPVHFNTICCTRFYMSLFWLQAPRIRRRKTSATSVSLFVRWYNPSGKTKVSHLALKPIETVDALQVMM